MTKPQIPMPNQIPMYNAIANFDGLIGCLVLGASLFIGACDLVLSIPGANR